MAAKERRSSTTRPERLAEEDPPARLRAAVWFAIGVVAGAGVAWPTIQRNAGEGEVTYVAASADGPVAASKCPSAPAVPPGVRRVLVRVPASCPDEGKTEGKTENPARPASVPAAFRPEAFVEKLDGAAARHGVHVPYAVDCSESPCMVVVEGPLAPPDEDAVMAWANGLHNHGGIPDADMWMFSNEAFTIFFADPDAQRDHEVFRERGEQWAREIVGRDDREGRPPGGAGGWWRSTAHRRAMRRVSS